MDDEAARYEDLQVRMIEVNGVELVEYQQSSAGAADTSLQHKKDNSHVPVEVVHAVTNNAIKKLFPLPNLIILMSVLCLMIIFILLVTLGVVRYVDRAKSETYYTREAGLES